MRARDTRPEGRRSCPAGGGAKAGRSGLQALPTPAGFSSPSPTSLNRPGDALEHDAERLADAALTGSGAGVSGQTLAPAAAAVADGSGPAAPSSVRQVLGRPGEPLGPGLRQDLESRFGYDLSGVRVHKDEAARRSAREADAQAYAAGRHVVFGTGAWAPHSRAGLRLIAHEVAHVIQQAHVGPRVQRLKRTPFPWRGVVTPAGGAKLRSAPDASDPKNLLGSMGTGHVVTVDGESGDFLQVSTTIAGKTLKGFVHHTLVDDASSAAMEATVKTTMVWKPSGPGSGTDFQTWAAAAKEAPFPAVKATTVMNCWEAVLLAAYRAGAIKWQWIHDLYTATTFGADWISKMTRGALTDYSVPGPTPKPQRGDLVFFDGLAHVALATGKGAEVYTFWPPPNTPFAAGGTTDQVKVFTIDALVIWWEANMPAKTKPRTQFGPPAW